MSNPDKTRYHRHLNSDNIKKAHLGTYEDFFSANSIAISCPGVLLWTPAYSAGRGGVVISGKIPFRAYIGLGKSSKNQGSALVFKKFISYFPEGDVFKESKENLNFWNSKAGVFINNYLKKQGYKIPLEVSILSEIPINRGWRSLHVICSALAGALFLHLGKCTLEELQQWPQMPADELMKIDKFNEMIRFGWNLASYTAGAISDGYHFPTSLIDSHYPLIYYRERDPISWNQYKDLGIDDKDSYYNQVHKINFRYIRMEELYKLNKYPEWPFDFGIIHVDKECPMSYICSSQYYRKHYFGPLVEFITKIFPSTVPDNFKERPYFLEMCEEAKGEDAWLSIFYKYRENPVILSTEFLKSFYNLGKFGPQPENLTEFFRQISFCQRVQGLVNPSTMFMDQVCSMINYRGHEISRLGVGTKMISPGIEGDLLLVTPYSDFEKVIKHVLPELEKTVRGRVFVEYIAKCDGIEGRGIKVEQYLDRGMFSPLISKESMVLKNIESNNQVSSYIVTRQGIEKEINTFDILGELDAKKIFIKGKPLSSEDIHSTRVTLEILNTFFKRQKSELNSSDFPKSSYNQDRNSMESKIIRPLLSAFKKYAKSNLDLRITGGLASKFSIIFKPGTHKIGLVSKK